MSNKMKHKVRFQIGEQTTTQLLDSINVSNEEFDRLVNFFDKIMTDLPCSKKVIRKHLPKMSNKLFNILFDYALEDNMIMDLEHSKFRKFTESDRENYGSVRTIIIPNVWYIPNVTCGKIFYYFIIGISKPFMFLKR